MRYRDKKTGKQVDCKRQGGGCINKCNDKKVIQEKSVATQISEEFIGVYKHEKDRYYDVVYVNKQPAHKHNIDQFTAEETVACKHVSRRQRDYQQENKSQRRYKYRVQEIFAHLCFFKRIDEILEVESFGQRPGISIKFGIFLNGC